MLLRYMLGWLSLSDALHELSQRMGISIQAIMLPFPEAAIDVDTPEDLALVKEIVRKREMTPGKGKVAGS
jgi:hypothetical protein